MLTILKYLYLDQTISYNIHNIIIKNLLKSHCRYKFLIIAKRATKELKVQNWKVQYQNVILVNVKIATIKKIAIVFRISRNRFQKIIPFTYESVAVGASKTMTCNSVLSSHSEQLGKTKHFYTPASRRVANSYLIFRLVILNFHKQKILAFSVCMFTLLLFIRIVNLFKGKLLENTIKMFKIL